MSDADDASDFSDTFDIDDFSSEEPSDEEPEEDPLADAEEEALRSAKSTPHRVPTKKGERKIKIVGPPKDGSPDQRISPPRMTKYEYAALIGERAEMISKGARIHPKYAGVDTIDLIKIAQMELDDYSIPFPLMIRRPVDNPMFGKIVEVFKVRELTTPKQRLTKHIEKYTPENPWTLF